MMLKQSKSHTQSGRCTPISSSQRTRCREKKNGCLCLSHAWCCPVTLVVDDTIRQPDLCRAAGEAPWKQAFWSWAEEMKTARSVRCFCQLARYRRWCQGDMTQNGTCSWAYSLLFTPTSQCSRETAFFFASSFPNGSRLGRFPQKSGTKGRCLYSASLPSSDLSSISLGFFPPFLRQSVPPSSSACQQAHHTHSHACTRTHEWAHTPWNPLFCLLLIL